MTTKERHRLTGAGTDHPDGKVYVAIKGIVFDVSNNKAYQPGGSYHGEEPRNSS